MKHWKIVAVKLIFERLLKQEIDGQSIIIDSTCMHLKFSTITLAVWSMQELGSGGGVICW